MIPKPQYARKLMGVVPLITRRYFGQCQLLMLWGVADDLEKIRWGGLVSEGNMGFG